MTNMCVLLDFSSGACAHGNIMASNRHPAGVKTHPRMTPRTVDIIRMVLERENIAFQRYITYDMIFDHMTTLRKTVTVELIFAL